MELRELKYFLAVVQEQNFSKAATFLNTTQPNLSRQIQNLEDEIGQQLIIRGSRNIRLTEAGIILRKRALEIMDIYNKMAKELITPVDSIKGEITIGCKESNLNSYITDIAAQVQKTYPEIFFNFTNQEYTEIYENLDKGLIDFAIVNKSKATNKYNYVDLPNHDLWGVIMKNDSPLANNEYVTLEELKSVPLIIPKGMCAEEQLKEIISCDLESYQIIATYNLVYTASLLVRSSGAYAISYDKLIGENLKEDLVFKPIHPVIVTNLAIIWKKYQPFCKFIEIFIDYLTK